MTYRVLSTSEGDQQDASFGGVAPLGDGEGELPRWVPYFHTTDTDATIATAQSNGGSVLMLRRRTYRRSAAWRGSKTRSARCSHC